MTGRTGLLSPPRADTLGGVLDAAAGRHPDRRVRTFFRETDLPFAALAESGRTVARNLIAAGVAPGMPVLVIVPDNLRMLQVIAGLAHAGAVMVPLSVPFSVSKTYPDAPVPRGVHARQPFFFRRRLLDHLDDRGELLHDGGALRPAPELLHRAALGEEEYFGAGYDSPTLRGMKHLETVADGVLAGRDGLELLEERIGAEETWRTWHYLMTDAPPKRACNALVARALDRRLRAGEPTVVFEGGAGLGATLREALRIGGFRERAKHITAYGFTGISRPLMNRARRDLAEAAPELLDTLRFDRVDLDLLDEHDDLPYLRDGAVDVVVFESVLHDVENLRRVLTSCHRMLKPGD